MRLKIDFPSQLPTFFAPPFVPAYVTASTCSTLQWQAQAASWEMNKLKVLDSYELSGIIFETALYDGASMGGGKDFEMKSALSVKDGGFVGDKRFGEYLVKQGIIPEKADPSHSVCSVGFIPLSSKWAGWSHRAMCIFGLGDRIFDANFGDENTIFTQHGEEEIKTLEDARLSACKFAEYVS